MSDIVFILGAGASKECGAPLMHDFLDVASRLLHSKSVEDKKEHFERVFKAIGGLQSVHSKSKLDITNIESIFTSLEIANVLGRLPNFEATDIPKVISSLKEVIVTTLEQTICYPTSRNCVDAPRNYVNFAETIKYLLSDAFPSQSVSIISFNYDVALDMALYKAGLGPDYGIPPASLSERPVPLYKLHGSLNWAVMKDTGEVMPLRLEEYFKKCSHRDWEERGTCLLEIGSNIQEIFGKFEKQVEKEPVIVPPTWNKADYHQMLAKIWSSAADHLSEAKSIFVLGYSLPETDAFFRLLYALGTVGDSPLDRLIVYNPDTSGDVDRRFKELLGPGAIARYTYKSSKFVTFRQQSLH